MTERTLRPALYMGRPQRTAGVCALDPVPKMMNKDKASSCLLEIGKCQRENRAFFEPHRLLDSQCTSEGPNTEGR